LDYQASIAALIEETEGDEYDRYRQLFAELSQEILKELSHAEIPMSIDS